MQCRHDVIVKAQTGSGKTLTYLVPMVAQAPLEYPWSTPGVPLEYPWSTPRVPLEYPWSTPGVPLTYLVPMVAQATPTGQQHAGCNVQRTPGDRHHAAKYNVQRATCNVQHATDTIAKRNVQRTTGSMQHALRDRQHRGRPVARHVARFSVLHRSPHRVVVCCTALSYVAPRRRMPHRVAVALSCSSARTRRS